MTNINNLKIQKIARELKNISCFINEGKYQEALLAFKLLEKEHPNNKTIEFNKLALLVDTGYGLKDEKIIQEGLDVGEKCLKANKYEKHQADLHYNLANGYTALFTLTERDKGIERIPQSENLQKAKSHFRKAVQYMNDFDFDLKKQLLVNYANCLDTLGRGMESLCEYNKALQIDYKFSMAIGNKAKALCSFADISGEYRAAIYVEAYQAINSIINNQDLIEFGGVRAKQSFEKELKKIKSLFRDRKVLIKKLKHRKYNSTKLSDFEKFYLELCIRETLFLNFHIHEDNCEAAIRDPLFISLITDVEDDDTFYKLAKYINQIKEDYATARLLLVQSQYKRKDFDRISRRTTFVNTLDYSQFNLYYGLLKSSFKEAYNILDKIAVFINDYYKLGLKEKKIYFTSIWKKDGKIRDEILHSKNISLYALYDIYQDFKSGYYERVQEIRNALTHRKLVIFDFTLASSDKRRDKYNIDYESMLNETINLLQLVRSAIIYLINFVNIEENKKRKKSKKPILPMYVDTSQFLEFL